MSEKEESIVEEEQEDLRDLNVYASAVVPETDDPAIPALTFRVWLLGTLCCILWAVANIVLQFRTNTAAVDTMLAILITYPLGLFLAKILPQRTYHWFGYAFTFNPGPFSIKEHLLIGIIASAGAAGAYGIDNVIVQRSKAYMGNMNITFSESLGWVLGTQFIGFGLAGLSRRFLVRPRSMLWPSILSLVALYITLHKPDEPIPGRWNVSRFKFFWISFAVIFVYTWIPEYFMNTLQAIAVLCFFTTNKTARFLGSGTPFNGVGIGMLTLDLYYVTSAAFVVPFVYMLNYVGGNVLYNWIIVPILFYTNAFNSPQFRGDGTNLFYSDTEILRPSVNHVSLFNRTGYEVNPRVFLNPATFNLDTEKVDPFSQKFDQKYMESAPIYISEMFAMNYVGNFLALSAAFSHVAIWHGKLICTQVKEAFQKTNTSENDIHNKLMSAYKDISEWVYGVFLLFCTAFMCIIVSITHFQMPLWAVFLGVGMTGLTLIPLGVIEGVTGTRIYINVLSQMIIGLLIPGNTIGVMAYKSLATNSANQALTLIADLKIGHYLKVPPIAVVLCQLYGTLIGAVVTTATAWEIMESMADLIGKSDWAATGFRTFYNAGAIWGAIGPIRFFGVGSPYQTLLYGFLLGFCLPFLPWLCNRIHPRSFWKYINIPLIVYVAGAGYIRNGIIMPFLVNFLTQFYAFRFHHTYWKKYNYVLAAAVSGGVSLCILLVSILVNLSISAPEWVGNPRNDPVDYYCLSK